MKKVLFLLYILFIISCVSITRISISPRLYNALLVSIEPNETKTVILQFSSNIEDGLIIPHRQDRENVSNNSSGYYLSQTTSFQNMLNEYIRLKFPSQANDEVIRVFINIDDFWIEEFVINSDLANYFHLITLGATNRHYMLTANLFATVEINKGYEILTKSIFESFEETYIQRGRNDNTIINNRWGSMEETHAVNINNVNNRILMILNSYFEELGL
jgi:hypothetical protein